MIESILIPTDGSDQAEGAVEYGLDLAEKFGAEVHSLYVIETKAHYIFTVAGHDPEEMEEYQEYGENLVEDVVDRAVERGLDGVGAVRKGSIAEEIVDYAEDKGIDTIVMGAQGRSDVEKYLIGSVTEKVVRISDIPVTTVRPRP